MSETIAPRSRFLPRLGLATRLYLAIGGAVLLTLMASVVAWLSFVQLGQDQRTITQEQIPAITQSLRLARQSALIAATVPKLLTVATDEERNAVMAGLREQQLTLLALVAQLKLGTADTTEGGQLNSIDDASAELTTALQELDRVVGEQIALRREMDVLIEKAVTVHRRLNSAIVPLLDDMTFYMVTGYRDLDDEAVPRESRISDIALLQYGATADLLAESNLMFGLLTETVSVPTAALLQPLTDRFVSAADRFQSAFDAVPSIESAEEIAVDFRSLLALGLSDSGIIELRRRILEAESVVRGSIPDPEVGIIGLRREIIDRMLDAQRLVERSRTLATSLTDEVERVVENAQAQAAATASASIRSIEIGQRVLLALNGVSIIGAILLGWLYVSRSFAAPVITVTRAAEDFERQRFDPAVLAKMARRGDELGHLARVFISMAEQVQARTDLLDRLVTERTQELNTKNAALEKSLKQIADELAMAQRMQLSILPRRYPELPVLDLFARMQAAREVGGDFYDIIEIDKNRVGLVIADVSDKGVPAALMMAVSCTRIRAIALQGASPGKVLAELNNTLAEGNDTAMFVTVFYGIVDHASGTFSYANGGHNAPYLLRAGADATTLPGTGGIALGLVPDLEYDEATVDLKPGDTVFLYTDGVTEAFSPEGDPFSELRLRDTLFRSRSLTVERLGRQIIDEVEQHSEGVPQSDDITCLVMRYQERPDEKPASTDSAVSADAGQAATLGAERFIARARNDLTELARLAEEVEAFGERRGLDMRTVYNVNLILDELLTNTINYGYDDKGDHWIDIAIDHRGDVLTITVEDDGKPFDPLQAKEPDLDLALEDRPIGGLGIHLVKTFMDDVRYERVNDRNRIVMIRRTGGDRTTED